MKYGYASVIFILGEIVALIIFSILKKQMWSGVTPSASRGATANGVLERLTLLIGLLHGFPQIVIAFGALKLGTRLHTEKECPISNSYFLVGNLISIFLAMVYATVARAYWGPFP